MTTLRERERRLKAILAEMGSVLVAYSGGADSAFLATVAHETLGPLALAVTASSPSLAPSELKEAVDLARLVGFRHRVVETYELEDQRYVANDPRRCYFCKEELYNRLRALAKEEGIAWVVNGTNVDDLGDVRPGLRAAEMYGVRSPLVEAGLRKEEGRALSRQRGLPTADKPAQACLSSRIPYGTPVSVEALRQIAEAEAFLRSLGIGQLRVRHHGFIARIEVEPQDMPRLLEGRERVVQRLQELGYTFVSLDLGGFRSGNLNRELPGPVKSRSPR